MTRDALLDRVREVARAMDGLFRVHREHPDLYGRARRMFGSWSETVRAAGVDYDGAIAHARRRSRVTLSDRARARRGALDPSRNGNDPETHH